MLFTNYEVGFMSKYEVGLKSSTKVGLESNYAVGLESNYDVDEWHDDDDELSLQVIVPAEQLGTLEKKRIGYRQKTCNN